MATLDVDSTSIEQQPSPQIKSSPGDLVNAMHSAFGTHHARAVHAKGIILKGSFTPSKEASRITKASHLQTEPSAVTLRFSDFTGIPDIPDNIAPANPRGLAIRFTLPDGTHTDIVNHSFNGFPVATTDEFREFLISVGASGEGAAKPTRLDQFLETHPLAKNFLSNQKTPVSYASASYFGVNSFKFTNAEGKSCFIRYQFVPEKGEHFYSQAEADKAGPQYLIDEIQTHITESPIRFQFYAQIADESDQIENPSIAWPESRQRVLLGTIELDRLSENTADEDKNLAFVPTHLPDGIEPADPMLTFRSSAYPISVKDRQ